MHTGNIQNLKSIVREKNFADDWVAEEGIRNAARRAAVQDTVQTAVDNPVELLKQKLMGSAHGSGQLLQVSFFHRLNQICHD